MVQQIKDPALSLQGLRLLLWRKFDRWLRNFHMPRVKPKREKNAYKREGKYRQQAHLKQLQLKMVSSNISVNCKTAHKNGV